MLARLGKGEASTGGRDLSMVSMLRSACELQLAKGADGAVVGPLLLSQLQVAWPQHHNHVQACILSSLCLCGGTNKLSICQIHHSINQSLTQIPIHF